MTIQMKRDVHLTGKDLMEMVQLRPEDVGKYALVPGPRERLDGLMKLIDNPLKNFSFMEYTMYTGTHQGIKITAINGGRFAADTGITTEILCNARVGTMIRLGSCGSLSPDIRIGDLVVADSAVPGDGVTPYYVDDPDFRPRADKVLTEDLLTEAKASGFQVHQGRVWSTDAILKETRANVAEAVDKGAVAVDMVTSAFLTICQQYGVPATVILAVSDHVLDGEMGFMDPNYYMAEATMINIVLSLVKKREGK